MKARTADAEQTLSRNLLNAKTADQYANAFHCYSNEIPADEILISNPVGSTEGGLNFLFGKYFLCINLIKYI